MRRTLSAVLLITVFVSLQFGKVATYLYCKWQAEIVQSNANCGCDDHLTSMFDHKDDTSKSDQSKLTLKEKMNEFTPKGLITVPQVFISIGKGFTEYNSSVCERFQEPPFHPPIA